MIFLTLCSGIEGFEMSEIFHDAEYSNLVWVTFDGNTWDDYHQLFNDVVEFSSTKPEPIVIAFIPQVDMPKSPPLSHLKWTAGLIKKADNILHMYVIVGAKHIIGQVFTELATKLFFNSSTLTVVKDKQAIYDAYQSLMDKNKQ